jgi:hypothetical protein
MQMTAMTTEQLIEYANTLALRIDGNSKRPHQWIKQFNTACVYLARRGVELDEYVKCPENW